MTKRARTPMCPIREGDPCTLCVPGATGPQDCGLVYLVMSDPELQELRRSRLQRADQPTSRDSA